MPYHYNELCWNCGGSGLIDMGPNQHGGPNVSETCTACHGKHYDAWLSMKNEERKERDQRIKERINSGSFSARTNCFPGSET